MINGIQGGANAPQQIQNQTAKPASVQSPEAARTESRPRPVSRVEPSENTERSANRQGNNPPYLGQGIDIYG